MDIGVVKEINQNEHRVALTPREVNALVEEGHRVFVEQGAGDDCLYVDADYRQAGAEIVFRRDEAFRRSKLILGVRAPSPEDVALLDEGQTIFGFLHLVMAPRELVTELLKRKVTAILKEFGWRGSIDCGGIDGARWLEALVPLWVRVGMSLNIWNHAFSVDRGLL